MNASTEARGGRQIRMRPTQRMRRQSPRLQRRHHLRLGQMCSHCGCDQPTVQASVASWRQHRPAQAGRHRGAAAAAQISTARPTAMVALAAHAATGEEANPGGDRIRFATLNASLTVVPPKGPLAARRFVGRDPCT